MAGISGATQVAGIIGWPVEHSLSPRMHNAAFAALRLDWVYVAFPVPPEQVTDALRGLAAAGVAGLNVTIPHKHAVVECCSAVSPAVEAIGAANTLVPDGAGGWTADNTDAPGFLRALDEAAALNVNGRRAVLIGAGGAARAVAFGLRGRGAEIVVANRTPERAVDIGTPVAFTPAAIADACRDAALVVNCTSLGLHGDGVPPELPLECLGPQHVVADVVYRPTGTAWLAAVAERGARTVDGRGMLLHQGAAAFAQWTGVEPPIEVMRAALEGASTS